MSAPPHETRSVTLSLSPEEHWTLHHVLLDRIEQEEAAAEPTGIEPPAVEVFQAFETLDAGETSFTIAQLDGIQTVLAKYHHSTSWWKLERTRIEQLLHHVTDLLDQHREVLSAD